MPDHVAITPAATDDPDGVEILVFTITGGVAQGLCPCDEDGVPYSVSNPLPAVLA